MNCTWCTKVATSFGEDGTFSCGQGQGDNLECHHNTAVVYTPFHLFFEEKSHPPGVLKLWNDMDPKLRSVVLQHLATEAAVVGQWSSELNTAYTIAFALLNWLVAESTQATAFQVNVNKGAKVPDSLFNKEK